MKKFAFASLAAIALTAASAANAGTLTFRVQNSTTATANATYQNACAVISPNLTSVAAGATSTTFSTSCGNDSGVIFDYTSGSKVCRFSLTSNYTPRNPITNAPAFYTPTGTGISRGGSARCTATLTAFDNTTGDYTWTVRIQ